MISTYIQASAFVFWDFDGVIKDSVDVKTRAFSSLFLPYGIEVAKQVRAHHEANGGVSRFEKIPLYLEWAGLSVTEDRVNTFCRRFSDLVLQAVIESPWVPGAKEYLMKFHQTQYFVLVSATPEAEIQQIIKRLGIAHYFREVYGAPRHKADSIAAVLSRGDCDKTNALMVGDAETDLLAAKANDIPFLLRRTAINKPLQEAYAGPSFKDFSKWTD